MGVVPGAAPAAEAVGVAGLNEYGAIRRMALRHARDAYLSQARLDAVWQGEEFVAAPDYAEIVSALYTAKLEAFAERKVAEQRPKEQSGRKAKIDKAELAMGEPRRIRDKEHLQYVASQSCLICGRTPSEAHHLRFAQARALIPRSIDKDP